MTRRRLFWTIWALLCGLPLLSASSVSSGSSFHVSPLTAHHTAAPGSVVNDRLLVVNNAEEPASYKVTIQDFTTDAEGGDTWSSLGSHPRSLGDWIRFAPSFFTLPAGGKRFVEYEIRVPGPEEAEDPHATAPAGSHWSALLIQTDKERPARAEIAKGQKGSSLGMRLAFVYAIKIYLDIEGTERPLLEAGSLEAGEEPGSLFATFANRGNVILRPRTWVEIRNLEGSVLATLDSLLWTLQPEGEHRYSFSLADLPEALPDGRYQVAVIADYGGPRLLGLTAPLNLKGSGGR